MQDNILGKKRNATTFFNRPSFKNNNLDLNEFYCIKNQINLPCNWHKSQSPVYSINHKIIIFKESGDTISTVKSVSGMNPFTAIAPRILRVIEPTRLLIV